MNKSIITEKTLSAYLSVLALPTLNRDQPEFLGHYESSENIFWINCSHCFSPLFQTTRHSPGRTYINVAALSTPLDRKPDSHVSVEEKVSWIEINDGLPQFKEKSSSL
ncbi:hypothetical protein GW915_02375 [bacterium]|nr:hypothetical protein [bacterium]